MRDEHKIKRQGKDYVLFAGLVAEAHDQFDSFSLQADLIEGGEKPLVKATFEGVLQDKDGNTTMCFISTGYGTAGRETDRKGPAVDAPIEMAETRAKARALRVAVNIGETAFEELPSEEEEKTETVRVGLAAATNTPRAAKAQRHNQPKAAPEDEFEPIKNQTKQKIELLAAELSDLRGEDYDQHMAALEAEIGEKLEETTEDEAQKWLGRYRKALAKAKAQEA